MIKVTALALLLGFVGAAAAYAPPGDVMKDAPPGGYYVFQKVVYQNDGGWPDDRAYFVRELHNIVNHRAAVNGQVEIRVVNWGPGLTAFQAAKTDPVLKTLLDQLRTDGVRFLICRNSLRAMNLQPQDLYGVTDADVVPSGVAELARLQGLGFVYIHP